MTKHLTQILKKQPEAKTSTIRQLGWMSTGERRLSDKVFSQHPVKDHGEPYENDYLGGVKQFNRGANHYGKDNVDFDRVPKDNEHPLRAYNQPVINNEETINESEHKITQIWSQKGGRNFHAKTKNGKVYKLNPKATNFKLPKLGDVLKPEHHTLVKEEKKFLRDVLVEFRVPTQKLRARFQKVGKQRPAASSPGEKMVDGNPKKVDESHDSMSHEARELVLHADNDRHLYNSSHQPILKNLARKAKKGIYNSEKAKKLWGYHADRAAQSYHKEHGSPGVPWHKMFTTAHRKEAAAHWEAYHRDNLDESFINEVGDTAKGRRRLVNYIQGAHHDSLEHQKDIKNYPNNPKFHKAVHKKWNRIEGVVRASERLAKEDVNEGKKKNLAAYRKFWAHNPEQGQKILDFGKKDRAERKAFKSAKKEAKNAKGFVGEELKKKLSEARNFVPDMHKDPEAHKLFRQKEEEGKQWHSEHPVNHMNIVNHYHQSTDSERHQGMHWYSDAHATMKALAHDTGTSHHQMAGLISNYSPQTHWHTNIMTAARVAREKRAVGGPGSGVFASTDQRKAGERILAGDHYDKVLKGQKIRHFAHLIEHGGNKDPKDPRVVIDRHAHSVASGARITDAAFSSSGLKGKKRYGEIHKAYVDAANHIKEHHGIDIHPHQLQAITWLTRQRLNATEEKGKGRNTAGAAAKSKAAWAKYAGEHHPHIIGQEPGTGYGE